MTGFGDAILRGDLSGLGRAAAIVGGLACTTAGYVKESLSERIAAWREASSEITAQPEPIGPGIHPAVPDRLHLGEIAVDDLKPHAAVVGRNGR